MGSLRENGGAIEELAALDCVRELCVAASVRTARHAESANVVGSAHRRAKLRPGLNLSGRAERQCAQMIGEGVAKRHVR